MSVKNHLILSALVRIIMIAYGEWHDTVMKVKYTDIDYSVITDGAYYILKRQSPFERPTYRYTPLLAIMMKGNFVINKSFGKIMFSMFDVLTGLLILQIAKLSKTKGVKPIICAGLWWYNPIPIVICTRGNADSVMTLLTLLTTWLLMRNKIILGAITFGFSIHFKLYPVIYCPALYLTFNCVKNNIDFKRLFQPSLNSLKFFGITLLSFVVPSLWSYYHYGKEYLDEALLYHISRKDIRHNFSPYFYWLYLTDTNENSGIYNYLVFIPQLVLFSMFALKFHRKENLPFCFFATTFTFVMFNKVCTSQYFLWFLCYLPMCIPKLRLSVFQGAKLAVFWVFGQALWLFFAYYLEFEGMNTYAYIFIVSMIFFVVNIWILGTLVDAYEHFVNLKSK